jgi:hypothetical protein
MPQKKVHIAHIKEEIYYLPFILQKVGWKIIIGSLILYHKYDTTEIGGSSEELIMTQVAQLENILTVKKVLNYLEIDSS